jgi:hypothetical protein
MIPERMLGALQRYVDHGIKPGDFLTAVLSNDLREACGRADDENQRLIFEYVKFLHNHVPSGCWGSPENVRNWLKRGGLNPKQEQ